MRAKVIRRLMFVAPTCCLGPYPRIWRLRQLVPATSLTGRGGHFYRYAHDRPTAKGVVSNSVRHVEVLFPTVSDDRGSRGSGCCGAI
jgi:hypothetical protein